MSKTSRRGRRCSGGLRSLHIVADGIRCHGSSSPTSAWSAAAWSTVASSSLRRESRRRGDGRGVRRHLEPPSRPDVRCEAGPCRLATSWPTRRARLDRWPSPSRRVGAGQTGDAEDRPGRPTARTVAHGGGAGQILGSTGRPAPVMGAGGHEATRAASEGDGTLRTDGAANSRRWAWWGRHRGAGASWPPTLRGGPTDTAVARDDRSPRPVRTGGGDVGATDCRHRWRDGHATASHRPASPVPVDRPRPPEPEGS